MIDNQPSITESDWIDTNSPAEGQQVQARAKDHRGFYLIPFAVEFRNGGWVNSQSGQELDCFISGWRPWDGAVHTL